jgi:hypothetical protein
MSKQLLSVIVLSLGVLLVCGCSQTLNNSRAAKLAQSYIDSQNGGTVQTSIGGLTNQLGLEMSAPLQAVGIQRLIQAGYIEERKMTVAYPNFSGHFSGGHDAPLVGRTQDTLELQAVAATKPPQVQGSFKICESPYSCVDGSVNGVIQKNGPSDLTLSYQTRDMLSRAPVTVNTTLSVSLSRGASDVLSGVYLWGKENMFVGAQRSAFRVTGRVVGPDIQQEVFVYSWTGKLPKGTVDGAALKLGHLIIDSCEQLLLNSETSAGATCKTQVTLTREAEMVFGSSPTDQPMGVTFGKQPDGTWVVTSVRYTPPPYRLR